MLRRIAIFISFFIFLMVLGTTANAKETRVTSPRLATDSCDTRWLNSEWNNTGDDVVNKMWASLKYRHCGNFDVFKEVHYLVDTDASSWTDCTRIDSITINWGAYGTWNPALRKWACDDFTGAKSQKLVYPANSQENIGHSNNDRCAYVYYRINYNWDNDTTARSYNKCLT